MGVSARHLFINLLQSIILDPSLFNESRELPAALGTGMNRSDYFVLRISGAACGIKLAKRPALLAQG